MTNTALKEKEENTTNSKDLMFINKVKINNDNTATISYKMSNDLAAQEVLFTGKDQITEDFSKIFQKAKSGFLGCIPSLNSAKVTMNAIKFDYGKGDFLEKALYSIKYAFDDNSAQVINISTPLLPIYKEELQNCFTIAGKDIDALHEIIAKAKAYIAGETRTKQMKLVVDNTNEG